MIQKEVTFCHFFLAAKDEQGEPLSDRELRDELMTMLFAGHDNY